MKLCELLLRMIAPDPVPLPDGAVTLMETTLGATSAAIVETEFVTPAVEASALPIGIKVRFFEHFPSSVK
jgi:hypothetical protein